METTDKKDVGRDYFEVIEYLQAQYEEVDGYSFYSDIFPDNERTGEMHTDFSRPNAIYLYKDPCNSGSKRGLTRRIMLSDTWQQCYAENVEMNEQALCSGLAYRARSNKLEHAQQCNALIFDLDSVGLHEIRTLFLRFTLASETIRSLPVPTYVVASGSGVHLYYVFDTPVELFPNIKLQMKSLKYDLTFRMWDYKSTSKSKNIQYQSINQGFRMVGSTNEKYNGKIQIRAFKVGGKVSIDYLNRYLNDKKNSVDLEKRFTPSKMTLEQAKLQFPEWYSRLYDENGKKKKNADRKKWDIAGKVHGDDPLALYHWWMKQAVNAKGGHRYYFLMCMSIYACKCDVSKKQLKQDMLGVYEELKTIEHDNPLRLQDVESALEAYSREYWNFTIDDISKLSDIPIQKNKRNGRKQADHLKRARAVQAVDYPDGEWRGNKSKKDIVEQWQQSHPNGKKADCIRDLGIDRKTVSKYWLS